MTLLRHHQLLMLAFGQPPRLLAADCADGPLQAAHAGLARVVANDVAYRLLRELDLLRGNAILLDLPRNQIAVRNVQLLFFAIALQLDDLHTVAQRLRDRVEHIRGRDEQHLRQIECHVEIVVAEARILLRIQRFQQRRSGVATEIAPDFIDLVEHENRIFGFGPPNTLNNLSGQRSDISSAMAANFRLVVHSA